MPDAPQQLIADRYRLVQPLGQGGMGRVWQARDEMLERDVAIKELVPPPGLTDDERREMRERSMREARAVARLDQVNVVRVFDVVHSAGDPWIVMELVQSRSLHQVLQAEGAMSPARVAQIGLGVLAALQAAHRAGVLHRDVKPANVLLAYDGRVVLTDFGLATVPGDPHVTRTGMVLGSPAYLAPERATDGLVGPAADLWSLGATLYAAVEGRTPYNRSSAIATLAALATEMPPPPQRADLLAPLLEGLLRRDPEQRIGTGEAELLLGRAAAYYATRPVAPAVGDGPDPARPPIVPEFLGAVSGAVSDAPVPTSSPTNLDGPSTGTGGGAAVTVAGRRRRGWLVGSLSAVLLLALLVSMPLVNGDLLGHLGGGAGSKSPGSPLASPTALTEASVSRVVPPPATGWHYYRDNPTYAVPVPDGWQFLRDGNRVEFREPEGSQVLTVEELRPAKPDLVAQVRAREKAERGGGRYPDYRQLRIGSVTYHVRAAEWEWTYAAAGGERMHAISRTFVSTNGQAYAIGWTTADADWSTSQGSFALIVDGFQVTASGAPSPGRSGQPGPGQSNPNPNPSGAAQPGGGQSPPPAQGAPIPNPGQPPPPPPPPAPPVGNAIINLGSKRCVDIPDSVAAVGVRLQMWDCHGPAGQKFTFPADGTVRSLGMCLDVANRSTSNGAAVVLAECNGGASQTFTLNKATDLVNVRADKCVDVIDGQTGNGIRLQIWDCTGAVNQKWRLG